MSLIPPHLVFGYRQRDSATGGISDTGWHLYVGVPEYDRDSWLILKFGRVEGAGIIFDYTAASDLVTVRH